MKTKYRVFSRLLVLLVSVFLFGVLSISVVQAAPPFQDPRPPADVGGDGGDGGDGGPVGGTGNGNGPAGPGVSKCAALNGEVLNWGFGPEPNVGLELSTGSWNVSTTSATDGKYGFGGLGVGAARLRVLLAPEQAAQLTPLVQAAGVYLNCDFPTIVNIAVYSGAQIEPPATIEMSAPTTLTADSQTPLKLTVKNGLPNEITNVIVTDLIPAGLVALEVKAASADPQNAKIVGGGDDGQLVVVYLDKLAAGAEANIFITLAAAPDVPPGTQIKNAATLFYRESVADQSQLDFTVGRSSGLAPSVAPAPTLQAEAAPVTEAEPVPEATPVPAPSTEAEEEVEEFVPPPESAPTTGEELVPPSLMPTTGEDALPPPALLPETGVGLLAPLSGVGLVTLAFLAHLLRTSNRPKR